MDTIDVNIFYDEQAEAWDLQVFNKSGVGPSWLHVDYFGTEEAARDYADLIDDLIGRDRGQNGQK